MNIDHGFPELSGIRGGSCSGMWFVGREKIQDGVYYDFSPCRSDQTIFWLCISCISQLCGSIR